MKKIISLFFAILIVLPMCLSVSAALKQPTDSTCKPTALAEMINRTTKRSYTPQNFYYSPTDSSCRSIQNETFTHILSNNVIYTGEYKTDYSGVSSASQLSKINNSLSRGVPIVVQVSGNSVPTHHWVTIISKDGNNYWIADPQTGLEGWLSPKYTLGAHSFNDYGYVCLNGASAQYTMTATAGTGGTATGSGTYAHGSNVTFTATPSTGYHFVKWSDGHTGNPYYFTAQFNHSTQAIFALNTYTMTATAGTGGTATGSGTYNHGSNVTFTAYPNTGYHFEKWSDGHTGNPYNFTAQFNHSTQAQFAKDTYIVAYNANGGSGAPSSQTKTYNTNLTLTNSTPSIVKTHTLTFNPNGGTVAPATKVISCTFDKWNTQATGSGTTYNKGATYTANAAATLYAQWNAPTIGAMPIANRLGYSFKGWEYQSSLPPLSPNGTLQSSTTVTARWTTATNISLNTTYNASIADAGTNVVYKYTPTTSGAYKIYSSNNSGDPYVSLVTADLSNEYELCTDDDGGGSLNFSLTYWLKANQTYYFKTRLYNAASTGSYSVRLEPVSNPTTYTVTYNGNATGVTNVPAADTKISSVSLSLSPAIPVRNGFKFLGWSTSSTASSPTYYRMLGQAFNTKYTTNANTTLYAIWSKYADADLNGTVAIQDSIYIMNYLADKFDITGYAAVAADVNGDGQISIQDSIEIMRVLAE